MINMRLAYLIGIVICFSIIFPGCNSQSNKWEKVHPDPERLPPDEEIDYAIDISKSNYDPLPHFFHPNRLQLISTIGSDSSLENKYYYHTRSKKIDIDSEGNIYIAQDHTNSINVYDNKGKFLYAIGGAGKGPGEFLRLVTFAFDRDYGKLYGLDYFEIEIFELRQDRFEYKATVPHGLSHAYDLCVLDSALYLSGFKIAPEDSQLHEDETEHQIRAKVTPPIAKIDLQTFETITSFGFEYTTYYQYGTYEGILSQMMLSCNEYSGTVVGYQKDFPYIFGYDRNGRKKWISKTEGYMMPQHIEFKSPQYNNAGLIQYTNEDVFNRKYPIQKIYQNDFELFQFVNQPPQHGAPLRNLKFRTILVDTRTGELFYSDAYDRIGVKKGNIVITVDRNPETFQRTFRINEYR